jgi:hypothetical protein
MAKQFDMFTDLEPVEQSTEITPIVEETEVPAIKEEIPITDEVREYGKQWKPKDKNKLGTIDHSDKLTHGWFIAMI